MGFDYNVALFFYKLGEAHGGIIYFFAEPFSYILGTSAVFVALHARKSKPNLSIALLTSVILSRFLVLPLIRIFIERPRPFVAHEVFKPLFEPVGFSFPSGHATAFFAIAGVMYAWNKKIGLMFFGGAIIISLSRIIAGVHYPLDILGGAILGTGVAFIVSKYVLKS